MTVVHAAFTGFYPMSFPVPASSSTYSPCLTRLLLAVRVSQTSPVFDDPGTLEGAVSVL